MEKENAAAASAVPRRRAPPRAVTVQRVERPTPRVVLVTFTGDALASFGPPRPGGHMKLFFAPPGWQPTAPGSEAEAPRPPSRTYTPRRWDPVRRELDVEFVLHGDGLAARWALEAQPGSPLYFAGPGFMGPLPERSDNPPAKQVSTVSRSKRLESSLTASIPSRR